MSSKKDKNSKATLSKILTNSTNLLAAPFSKMNIIYSRFEAYFFTVVLLVFVWNDKDVEAISNILALSWFGYKGLQAMYIWMAKHEHVYELKMKYKDKGLDTGTVESDVSDDSDDDDE